MHVPGLITACVERGGAAPLGGNAGGGMVSAGEW